MQQKQFANSGEAREMLLRLEEFYNEPVLTLHHFCRAMELWFDCIEKNNTDPALRRHDREQGYGYFQFLNQMSIDIRKSNLLGRLLYGKEPLRTRKCPVHKGHYDGEAMFFKKCPHECDGTGWLRERESDRGVAMGTPTTHKVVELVAMVAAEGGPSNQPSAGESHHQSKVHLESSGNEGSDGCRIQTKPSEKGGEPKLGLNE